MNALLKFVVHFLFSLNGFAQLKRNLKCKAVEIITGNINKHVDKMLSSAVKKYKTKLLATSYKFKVNSSTRCERVTIKEVEDVARVDDSQMTRVCNGVYELSLTLRIKHIHVSTCNCHEAIQQLHNCI